MLLFKDNREVAKKIYEGLGTSENIVSLDNCSTRLRAEVKNIDKVRMSEILASGAKDVQITGEDYIQVVLGTKAREITLEVKDLFSK